MGGVRVFRTPVFFFFFSVMLFRVCCFYMVTALRTRLLYAHLLLCWVFTCYLLNSRTEGATVGVQAWLCEGWEQMGV